MLLKEIDLIDKIEIENLMTDMLHSKRLALKSDHSSIELKQAQLWAQRSRKNWLIDGDENKVFFHTVCSINQRKNLITEVEDSNGVIQNTMVPSQKHS